MLRRFLPASGALWTFPLILLSAFVIAWAAEVSQFFLSEGLALAVLAWLQTLPEFAVEAEIAWRRDVSNMTANFTGSLRLLVGLGWPLIFAVASLKQRRATGKWLLDIELEEAHSVEVVGLLVPILYFTFVWWKGSLTVVDGAVLFAIYFAYLFILNRMPPKDQEEASELDFVPRKVHALPGFLRAVAIVAMFLAGGLLLLFVIHPFVDSLRTLAITFGLSEYVFIQWVAPLLSEFPEFQSAVRWAASVRHAPMALMNLASSNINQWTVLAGMIPLVYSISSGHVAAVPLVGAQSNEVLLTILQSLLGMVLLVNMRYSAWEAVALFLLWFAQFVVPSLRGPICWAYGALIAAGVLQMFSGGRSVLAFTCFAEQFRSQVLSKGKGWKRSAP